MTPTTSNAYYGPHQNKFVMPAGILQNKPFYFHESEAPSVLNYGAIGTIISHEVSHSIDDWGKLYDEFGNMSPWWDNTTKTRFNERAQCFVEQFETFSFPTVNMTIRGAQTVGENIADNGAVRIAFDSYHQNTPEAGTLEYQLAPDLTFTDEQLFFISFAQMWCSFSTDKALRLEILQSNHSPSSVRVVGALLNFGEFARVFKCSNGTNMNLYDEDLKCRIW